MSYSQWRNYGTSHRYEKKSIKKDPLLQARIEVILKEDLDNRSKDFVESLLKFCTDNGGLTDRQLNSFKKLKVVSLLVKRLNSYNGRKNILRTILLMQKF